jgi:hypothetical protein
MILEHGGKQMSVNRMNIKVSISEWFFRCIEKSAREDGVVRLKSSPGVTAVGSDPTITLYTLPSGE